MVIKCYKLTGDYSCASYYVGSEMTEYNLLFHFHTLWLKNVIDIFLLVSCPSKVQNLWWLGTSQNDETI